VPRAEPDASGDLTGTFATFIASLRTTLLERYGDPATVGGSFTPASDGPAYSVTEVVGGPLDALAARHNMVSMTVTVSSSLTDPDYPRIKRFVWLALPGGTTYRTGDHLAVLPTNDDDLVAGAARVLQVDLDTALSIMPSRPQRHGIAVDRPLTVRELLTRHIELQGRPTAAQLVTLAELNPCPLACARSPTTRRPAPETSAPCLTHRGVPGTCVKC
jgi:cytochrome P450/NADPH-cytochrome P450 reductase